MTDGSPIELVIFDCDGAQADDGTAGPDSAGSGKKRPGHEGPASLTGRLYVWET
jgi:hypothetical protein